MNTPKLEDFFQPGQPLPPDYAMIEKALEVLSCSPHGQQLTNFAEKKEVRIQIVGTPEPVTYIPEKKLVYIGFNRDHAVSPAAFILMLAGALREAQQEAAGIKHPALDAPESEHRSVSMAKEEDKAWHICRIAHELNALETFDKFHFIEELRKIGYSESYDLFLKQQDQK